MYVSINGRYALFLDRKSINILTVWQRVCYILFTIVQIYLYFSLLFFFPLCDFSILIYLHSSKILLYILLPQNLEPMCALRVPAMAAAGFAAQSILRRVVPSFLSTRPTTHVVGDFFSGTNLILRTPLHPSGMEISSFLACLLFDDFVSICMVI